VSIRNRLLAPCAALLPDEHDVVNVDIGALVRRLLLFDTYILQSLRFLETRALVETFDFDGLLVLLDSGALKVRCQAYTLGHFPPGTGSEVNAFGHRLLPPLQFRPVVVTAADQRSYISQCFRHIASAGVTVKQERKLKRAYADAFVPDLPQAVGISAARTVPVDFGRKELARRAIAEAAKSLLGVDVPADQIVLNVFAISEEEFRLESNLSALCGCDELTHHKVLERAALTLGGLNLRFGEMQYYGAVSGVLDEDTALATSKLDFLLREAAPAIQEEKFRRIISIAGLPEVAPKTRIDVEALLRARTSDELVAFRAWLSTTDSASDAEVADLLRGVRSRVGSFMSGTSGKTVRLLATTALGAIPGMGTAVGLVGGAIDTFLVERLFPTNGPALFLSKYYPRIFESR
jgi:hypothetical protein